MRAHFRMLGETILKKEPTPKGGEVQMPRRKDTRMISTCGVDDPEIDESISLEFGLRTSTYYTGHKDTPDTIWNLQIDPLNNTVPD
ncbi:MAG: hypothetical protein AYK19_03715 [Theionarchaea archaeon DG-70-1]|nr:MAG: hypothetical protein AYK19_03715 [Theionarchaea archaeon DG-70-1]